MHRWWKKRRKLGGKQKKRVRENQKRKSRTIERKKGERAGQKEETKIGQQAESDCERKGKQVRQDVREAKRDLRKRRENQTK